MFLNDDVNEYIINILDMVNINDILPWTFTPHFDYIMSKQTI